MKHRILGHVREARETARRRADKRHQKATAFYRTTEWRNTRAKVLRRHRFCTACAEAGKQTLAREVDHIKPIRDGGAPLDERNLQPLCRPCHTRKTTTDLRRRSRSGAP